MTDRNTTIPRPFSFQNIGNGDITQEAVEEYKTWAPAIQLLEFDNGRKMIRFCYYVESGKLAPRALSLDDEDILNLKKQLRNKPQIKEFLQRLLD